MFLGTIFLVILYFILKYVLSWIVYFNNLDSRFGNSTWRWSYDYPVIGERDISDLDDKKFVRLRRFRNSIVTVMYCTVFIFFIVFMSFTSHLLILILN